MTQINISLPDELIRKTKDHMKNTGKTFSGMVRVSLEKQLEGEQ